MFNVETHTAAAVDTARKAANAADKSGANLDQAFTAVFAAYLAADHGLTAKDVSKILGDKVPQSKLAGNPSAVRKSRCSTFFSDSANLATLRTTLINPEAMEPEDFNKAVSAYAKGVNPRQWIAEQKAAKDLAKKAGADAKAAGERPMAEDEEARVHVDLTPGLDPVEQAHTTAAKAIAALLDMASRDCPERDDANAALTRLLTQLAGSEVEELAQAA